MWGKEYLTEAGHKQIKNTTIDLDQVAASYDLFTASGQDLEVESLCLRLPNVDVSDDVTITGISIQTDDVTPQVLVSQANGVKANLTAEAQLSWTGTMRLDVGAKIQLTIYGGAADAATVCDVNAGYRAIANGGKLA